MQHPPCTSLSRRWHIWAVVLLAVLQLGSGRSNRLQTPADSLITRHLLADTLKQPSQCADVVKTYDNVKYSELLDAPVLDLIWAGEDDEYVFVVTVSNQHLWDDSKSTPGYFWRSKDYGATFARQDGLLRDALPQEARDNIRAIDLGVRKVHLHLADAKLLLLQGWGSYYWISKDGGEHYEAVDSPGKTMGYAHEIRLHPQKADWVLALVRRNDCAGGTLSKSCVGDLFVSQDFGRSWSNITANAKGKITGFVDFDWAQGTGEGCIGSDRLKKECQAAKQRASALPAETIMATGYENANAKGPYAGWSTDIHFFRSTDFFAGDVKKLIDCGNQFEVIADKVYLALKNDCPVDISGKKRDVPKGDAASGVTLYVSADMGDTFDEVCLPTKLSDAGYSLLPHPTNGGAYLVTDHLQMSKGGMKEILTNAYDPGPHPAIYSISMRNVYSEGDQLVPDFLPLEGISGVMIANEQTNPDMGVAPGKSVVQTKVSYSGGAHWQLIPMNTRDIQHSECNRCGTSPVCYLHLHGNSAWFTYDELLARPSVYSHPSAPGIIMASGNTAGANGGLSVFDNVGLCTWMSRDGGITWKDVAIGSHIFEFGDSGGVLIMAKYLSEGPTQEVFFSLDEGDCWNTVKLTTALTVSNIRVEPDGVGHKFIIEGRACYKSQLEGCTLDDNYAFEYEPGLIYMLDVKEIGQNTYCNYPQDYEHWVPKDSVGAPLCVLGKQYNIFRQQDRKYCLNSKGFDRPIVKTTSCNCTMFDTECDYGFEADDKGQCKKIKVDKCPLIESGNYLVSETHLRTVLGTNCSTVSDVIHDTDGAGGQATAPGKPPPRGGSRSSRVGTFFAVVAVLAACFVVGAVWWVKFASTSTKETISEVVSPVTGTFTSLYEWARDLLQRRRTQSSGMSAYEVGFQPLRGNDGAMGHPTGF